MKIDQTIQYQATMPNNTQNKAATRSAQEASSSGKADGAAYSVTISKTAGNLMKATELLAKAPSGEDKIRPDKVAAIKDQLAAGSYNISGKDVATKILNALKG
jgi:flagellar biosynthesis anti-sigma factor FlgM